MRRAEFPRSGLIGPRGTSTGVADFRLGFGSLGVSTSGQDDGIAVFGAGVFGSWGWLRLALDFVYFDRFGGFFFSVFNDFGGWGRGSWRNFFRFWNGGINFLGDVGSRVEIGGGPVKRIEAAELLEFAIAGGDGAFGGGDVLPETGETASGAGGGLVGAGQGDRAYAGGEHFVVDFYGYGLKFVFEEEETDAAEALAFPLAGGEAVDDLFFGMVAGAEFGHECVENAGVIDHRFAGEENGIGGGRIVDELGMATVFEAVTTGAGFAGLGFGAGALLGIGAVDFGAVRLFLGVGRWRFHRVLLKKLGVKRRTPYRVG